MKQVIYYTYLIGWIRQNKWYYGVRYSSKSHPNDLWATYFTSSKVVKKYRTKHGEPDVVSIRRRFSEPIKAKDWEEKVLRRLNTRYSNKWLNLSQPDSFKNSIIPWNKGLTKETCDILKETGKKISKSCKGRVSERRGYKCTQEEKDNNSWYQLKNRVPFNSYQEFKNEVYKLHKEGGLGPYAIAKLYGIDGTPIKRIIGKDTGNQSWTKLKRNNPSLPFDNYYQFVTYCKTELSKGRSRWSIKTELKVSEDAVKRALTIEL